MKPTKSASETMYNKRIFISALILFLFLFPGIDWNSCSAQNLNDGAGAYFTGNYCNLFNENGHLDKEIDAKAEKVFNQLFHGDSLQRGAQGYNQFFRLMRLFAVIVSLA